MLDTPAVIAFGRLVVLGGDAQRIHEEIVSAGGTVTEGRFRRFETRGQLDRIVEVMASGDISDGVGDRLVELWDTLEKGVSDALTAVCTGAHTPPSNRTGLRLVVSARSTMSRPS